MQEEEYNTIKNAPITYLEQIIAKGIPLRDYCPKSCGVKLKESEDNNEERLKKLEEELDYAKFCCDLDRRLLFKGDKI